MTNRSSNPDGTLGKAEHSWLMRRANGGFGLVTSCGVYVSDEGQSWHGQLGLTTRAQSDSLRPLASDLRNAGAIGIIQLFHGGLRANPAESGHQALAPSASPNDPWASATEDNLWRIIANYRESAARAANAGFDGIEIHGAHGYLPAQFLSAIENTRTDRWGGSLENRARLLREVVRGIRGDLDADFLIGVRLSSEDARQSRGIDIDESLSVAKWMAEDGADFVHLSLWDVERNSAKYPNKHPITLFRAVLPRQVALMVAGKIWTADDADRALHLGADLIALGRAGILNPDWPHCVLEHNWKPERGPLTESEFDELSVGSTFFAYLGEKWPELIASTDAHSPS
jgi:2,4-dienoyl-CoA reductase-like NADH-dependent reductase (Old Yellow Enzyme family)